MTQAFRLLAVSAAALLLTGCASVNFDQALDGTRQATQSVVPNTLELRQTSAQPLRSAAPNCWQTSEHNDAVELHWPIARRTLLAQRSDMASINQRGALPTRFSASSATSRWTKWAGATAVL
jgi:hypothetical protein